MPFIEGGVAEGVTARGLKTAVGEYNFATDGGAISTIALMGQTAIPSGATIVGGFVDVITQCTGASASIAIQVNAANDIITTVAIASWTVGVKNILPSPTTGALTASTAVRTTAARDISIVITAGAVTAGRFKVVLFYADPLV